MKTYKMADLEWCGGRMAHLRVPGEFHTICHADPKSYEGSAHLRRPVLTTEEAAEKHQCKSCLKRVET